MNYKIQMILKDCESGLTTSVEDEYDDEDYYAPEIMADVACKLLAGAGYADIMAHDVQSLGWERYDRELPPATMPGDYLVAIANGKYMKTDKDYWNGKKFDKYEDQVIFYALMPSSPMFWSRG